MWQKRKKKKEKHEPINFYRDIKKLQRWPRVLRQNLKFNISLRGELFSISCNEIAILQSILSMEYQQSMATIVSYRYAACSLPGCSLSDLLFTIGRDKERTQKRVAFFKSHYDSGERKSRVLITTQRTTWNLFFSLGFDACRTPCDSLNTDMSDMTKAASCCQRFQQPQPRHCACKFQSL